MTDKALSSPLSTLTPYVYGTTRLGDGGIEREQRVEMARSAMKAGVWFHTSHQYGDALEVLRTAFDQARGEVPRMIYKIGWESAEEVRATIHQLTQVVDVPRMNIGQLCLNGSLAEDFRKGGACCEEFAKMKREGLVQGFLLQVFPWTSDVALDALLGGHTEGIVDGYILYLNPLQRFASNELWDQLQERHCPLVAMRTVAGGNVHDLRDVPGAAWKPYLQERATQVAPLFDRSGVNSWPEFCVRYAHSVPGVVATVGSTSRPARLDEFVAASQKPIEPLPSDIVADIASLQRVWAAEVDAHGVPGSM